MQAAGGADGDDARDAEGAGGARGGGRRRAEGGAVGGSEGAKVVVLSIVLILKRSFYHDRLGTNIGKSSQKIVFAEGPERSPRLPARNLERCAHRGHSLFKHNHDVKHIVASCHFYLLTLLLSWVWLGLMASSAGGGCRGGVGDLSCVAVQRGERRQDQEGLHAGAAACAPGQIAPKHGKTFIIDETLFFHIKSS